MQVIILNDFAYIEGGASQIAIYTAKKIAEQGINTCLFTGVGPIDLELKNIQNLEVICLNQHDILRDPNRFRAMIQGIWNYKSRKIFKSLLKKYDKKDTIIHVHTCQKALSSSCIQLAIKLGYKVIYHMHDFGIACPNLGFYNYKKKYICKKQAMSMECLISNCDSRKYTHKLWRFFRQYVQINIGRLPRDISAFIAVSKFSLNILNNYLPNNKKIYTLSNPIDIINNEKVNIVKNKLFLFIGRLSPEKNPILLAKVAKELNIQVVFIGDGICKEEIKRINPKAILTGWIKKELMMEYLLKARCLIMPSLWYETQGLVVIEAAAFGIPAIVPDTCAATDFIKDGINGLIFKSNDAINLKDKINIMLNEENIIKFSDNMYKCYKKYNEQNKHYIDNLLDIYRNVIKENINI